MQELNQENVFYINIQGESKKLRFKEAIDKYLLLAYDDEQLIKYDLFVLPTVNFAKSLLDNIESCYFQKQFITCAILVRSLLDATMSMVYFLNVPKEDYTDFFQEYLDSGEITKSPNKKGKRHRVSGQELCKKFKQVVNYDMNESYKYLSKYVHPTIKHFDAIYKDKGDGNFAMPLLGEETKFLDRDYEKLYKIVYICMDVLMLILLERNDLQNKQFKEKN